MSAPAHVPPYKLTATGIFKSIKGRDPSDVAQLRYVISQLQQAYGEGYQAAQRDMREALGIEYQESQP